MQIRHTKLFKYLLTPIFFFILFSSMSFLYIFGIVKILEEQKSIKTTNTQILGTENIKEKLGLPVRLTIPIIDVDAEIQLLGVNTNGEMDVPNNAVDVGWYGLGPRPGENGSAVIAGHLDGEDNEIGVFVNLDKLKKGDQIYIKDNEGKIITFEVREKRTYDPGYADDVFNNNDMAHLNLVTCGGLWDETKHQYSKRLVVFSDIIKD